MESANGHRVEFRSGGQIAVNRDGQTIGYHALPKAPTLERIDSYTRCFDLATHAMQAGRLDQALVTIETAMSFAPTLTARYNRGMILLELGRWQEGFENYTQATESSGSRFMRPQYRACLDYGLPCWRGEDLDGKHLLLIHDHGFGDSIMMLRYVRAVQAMGARVTLWLPPELRRLATPLAEVTDEIVEADYFCPLLFLLPLLQQTPATIPLQPYLSVDPALVNKWRARLDLDLLASELIGVAWTPGRRHDGDYPRSIPFELLKQALPDDAVLVSVQQQGAEETAAFGVECYSFEDFADCAALMSCCSKIVTVDTAAVHLAGAIGHPRISLLLGHWSSWRWLSPLYQNICVCKQTAPNDHRQVSALIWYQNRFGSATAAIEPAQGLVLEFARASGDTICRWPRVRATRSTGLGTSVLLPPKSQSHISGHFFPRRS